MQRLELMKRLMQQVTLKLLGIKAKALGLTHVTRITVDVRCNT